jgi:hypothetical protein
VVRRPGDGDGDVDGDGAGTIESGAGPRRGVTALAPAKETSFAPQSNATFVEPWLRRVRDVDDDTLAGLLHQLISLRRLRNGVAAVCCAVGMSVFGVLQGLPTVYMLLVYAVLAVTVGFPVFAIGSLSVRRLFLREAQAQGLSRAAAMLVLTRAERRARLLAPWKGTETKVTDLMKAVRDPDEA